MYCREMESKLYNVSSARMHFVRRRTLNLLCFPYISAAHQTYFDISLNKAILNEMKWNDVICNVILRYVMLRYVTLRYVKTKLQSVLKSVKEWLSRSYITFIGGCSNSIKGMDRKVQ